MTPEAATAGWLARIPAAQRAAAEVATSQALLLWFAGGALTIAVAWLAHRSGLLQALARRIETDGPRPWSAAFAGAGALGAVLAAALAGFEVGLLHTPPALAAQTALIRLLAALVLAPLLLALMRRAPRTWWAWAGALAMAASLALVWGPYAAASGPANLPPVPPGDAREGLTRLLADAGLPAREVYVSDNPAVWADVTGTPGAPRVTVSRPMLAKASPAEIRANVGHLISHYRHADTLVLALVIGALAAVGMFAAHALYRPMARLMAGPAATADPAALPVLAVIGVLWLGVATPAFATFIRAINVRADQESLDTAREPDGLAASLLHDWDGRAVDPGPLAETVLYTHPPLAARIRHAMAWKAAHPFPATPGAPSSASPPPRPAPG